MKIDVTQFPIGTTQWVPEADLPPAVGALFSDEMRVESEGAALGSPVIFPFSVPVPQASPPPPGGDFVEGALTAEPKGDTVKIVADNSREGAGAGLQFRATLFAGSLSEGSPSTVTLVREAAVGESMKPGVASGDDATSTTGVVAVEDMLSMSKEGAAPTVKEQAGAAAEGNKLSTNDLAPAPHVSRSEAAMLQVAPSQALPPPIRSKNEIATATPSVPPEWAQVEAGAASVVQRPETEPLAKIWGAASSGRPDTAASVHAGNAPPEINSPSQTAPTGRADVAQPPHQTAVEPAKPQLAPLPVTSATTTTESDVDPERVRDDPDATVDPRTSERPRAHSLGPAHEVVGAGSRAPLPIAVSTVAKEKVALEEASTEAGDMSAPFLPLPELRRFDAGFGTAHQPATTTISAREIVAQVAVAAIETSADEKMSEITLDPEELGRVKIQLRTDGAHATLVVSAERLDVTDAMRRHVAILEQEFRNQGFTSVSMSFAHFGGDAGGHPPGTAATGAPGEPTEGGGAISADPGTLSAPLTRMAGGGLDLRL